jgi:hypothetical protein
MLPMEPTGLLPQRIKQAMRLRGLAQHLMDFDIGIRSITYGEKDTQIEFFNHIGLPHGFQN